MTRKKITTMKKTTTMSNLSKTITVVGDAKENGFSQNLLSVKYNYAALADQLMANGVTEAPNVNSKYLQRLFLEDRDVYSKIRKIGLDYTNVIDSILAVDFSEYKDLDLNCIKEMQERFRYNRNTEDIYNTYKFLKGDFTDQKLDGVSWLTSQKSFFKFDFKSALTDLAVPLSKGYLINLRINGEDQFYRIIDLTKNDEQALEELASQFNNTLLNSIFYVSPKLLVDFNERLKAAGVSEESIIYFNNKDKFGDEWISKLVERMPEYSAKELDKILQNTTLFLAACVGREIFDYICKDIINISKSDERKYVDKFLAAEKYDIVRNLCTVIGEGFWFKTNSALEKVLDSDKIDANKITIEQIKRLAVMDINSNTIEAAYEMDCEEYEFLFSIPRKYSLLAECLQQLERSKRLETVRRMLDHNALAYISKAEVDKVANKIVEPMEALNLPIPLYVKLLSSVDERLIKQVKTLEDAQFLAWCLPENVNPESKLDDIKYGFFTSDIYSTKMQAMFGNLTSRVNMELLYNLCLSRDAKFIIDYLLDKSVNKTSKKLLKLALASYICGKYYDFKYKENILGRELALKIPKTLETFWKSNSEFAKGDITIKECDGFLDIIEFGLDPINMRINIKNGSDKYALPSMFCANRKVLDILKNGVCIAQAQLLLTKISSRNSNDEVSTTIEQSDFETADVILMLDSINYINGCDKTVKNECAPLIVEFIEKRAEELGVRPAFTEIPDTDASYKQEWIKIFVTLTRSGCQKFLFKAYEAYFSYSEGTYLAQSLFVKE